MKKTLLAFLCLNLLFIPVLLSNSFPDYEGVVQVEGKSADEIYGLIKTSLSKLQLAELSEITADAENKHLVVSGYNTFHYSLMAVRIDGRVIMNIDFKVRDGRFKYDITVTDVYVENTNGMKQSAYEDLIKKPKSQSSKKIFPHVNRVVDEMTERIQNIATVKAKQTDDNW